MDKLWVVKEYDSLTGNSDYKNSEQFTYLPEEIFSKLLDFIHKFAGDDTNADALEFMKPSYKRNVGDVVTIKNYVGLIQFQNGYQIEILPKIQLSQEDGENVQTKRTFLRMLRSMKDFQGKVLGSASLKVERMNLYEIFIHMYLEETRKLVKHGIKSGYITQEDNLRYFKGKLKASQHIRANLAHQERFYMAYDEFHPDRPENKLVKATLLKLQKLSTSAENSKEIKQLLTYFEFVHASTNYQKDFSKVKLDRSTKDYAMLMEWSKVFLFDKSFSTFAGDNESRALLFPMEKIFESYVAQQIRNVFEPEEWDVSTQDKGYYLFEEPRKQFALRPDIVLEKEGRTIIMDTKWKRLIDDERKNYGISQADMYQMYAYSKKYETSEIWLLYPITEEFTNEKTIRFDSGDGTIVNVFFVDLEHIEESLKKLRKMIENK